MEKLLVVLRIKGGGLLPAHSRTPALSFVKRPCFWYLSVSVCRIPEDAKAAGTFLAKADGVLAGLAVADAVFHACDPVSYTHLTLPTKA